MTLLLLLFLFCGVPFLVILACCAVSKTARLEWTLSGGDASKSWAMQQADGGCEPDGTSSQRRNVTGALRGGHRMLHGHGPFDSGTAPTAEGAQGSPPLTISGDTQDAIPKNVREQLKRDSNEWTRL